ncbi:hypothetical protein IAU59_004638 [Kwoniella sp. CBS 9459]
MEPSAEAGPSRLSPTRILPPLSDSTTISDVVMEDLSVQAAEDVTGGGGADEAVQLLLNISSVADGPAGLPPKPELMEVVMEDTVSAQKPGPPPPDTHSSYPYTPPDEPHVQEKPQITTSSTMMPSILTSALPDDPTPSQIPSTSRTSPEPATATKPKQKRKRNTTGGSSRRASSDRPQHWLGEDNSIIRCICGFTEDDGFTIQCEGCGAWEHGLCFGYMDESQAPESYFCELCQPRPFDAVMARQKQTLMQQARETTAGPVPPPDPAVEKEKPRSRGGKAKRARMESVVQDEQTETREAVKENSPGVMGPPAIKPKRRPQGGKPRAKQNTVESTPGPSIAKEAVIEEPEDDYFHVDPWMMEYTPIRANIVRGQQARQIMRNLYKEWVDAEEEVISSKNSRTIHNPSGLPSPTETGILRLSPDNLFPTPDFSILAPPVPPAFVSGPDLEAIGTPISIKPVQDAPSFLPLNYAENISKHGVYTRPTIYSVFVDEPVMQGSFIGEYRGEIVDCETYRRDPINQYASLGMPKPHVRSIGPPINLMIDARGYGCDLRFVRSGCHPNVVLRPLLWKKIENEPPKLKFGLFAAKDIGKKDELILGWEWDDQHVVHSLRSVIHAAMLSDGSLASPSFSVSDKKAQVLASKIDSVLTHIFGTFTACACVVPGTCALAQMGQVVDPKAMQDNDENGRKKHRVDLGDLVGAVRGWRRREVEMAEAKKWKSAEPFNLGLSRMSSRSSLSQSTRAEEDEDDGLASNAIGLQMQRQDSAQEREVDLVNEAHEEERRSAKSESGQGESETEDEVAVQPQADEPDMALDEDEDEQEQRQPQVVAAHEEEQDTSRAADGQIAITETDALPSADEQVVPQTVASPEKSLSPTHKAAKPTPSSSPTRISYQVGTPISPVALNAKVTANDIGDSLRESTYTVDSHPPTSPSPSPRPSSVVRMGSSSSLSSAISSISVKHSLPDDLESGSDSDMTEATIPKSQFSESELDSATESEEETENVESRRQGQQRTLGNAKKARRVLSPVIESGSNYNHHDVDHHMSDEEERELVVKKVKKTKERRIPASSPKSAQKPTAPLSKGKKERKLDTKSLSAQNIGKRGRAKRIVSSSASEDEDDDSAMDIDGSPRSSSRHIASSPKSGKSVKLERLEAINSNVEPRAVVPDQVAAPMSSALELTDVAIPDPGTVPPPFDDHPAPSSEIGSVTEVAEKEEEEEEEAKSEKEPTPPPREPTPPPKPLKKVALSDYLKSHKFRKEAQTPVSEAAPVKPEIETTVSATTSSPSIDGIPGFGATATATGPAPVAPAAAMSSSPIKGGPETPSMAPKLNLFEHLPSSRPLPGGATSPATPFDASRPTTTLNSSYVPRSASGSSADYFPLQPSLTTTTTTTTIPESASVSPAAAGASISQPAFVPRVSSSYIPRQASVSENDAAVFASTGAVSPIATTNASHVPQASASEERTPQGMTIPLPAVSAYIPRSPRNPPPEMPPPLPAREPPPHTEPPPPPPPLTNLSTSPTAPSSLGISRLPPTGPKVPPTGPRGLAGAPPIPPPRGLGEPRGGYGGGRGYSRGGWRGRGFRGGWRGN